MKTLNYPVLSSVCALAIGGLLMVWPEVAVVYLVIAIGALFFLPGILGVLGYFLSSNNKNNLDNKPMFPLVALGSTLLGLWLMVMPYFFVNILMYLLGGLLVLGGLKQLLGFIAVRNQLEVPVFLYLVSIVVLISGLVILFNPFEAATVPFIILGISSVVYGLTDLIRLWRYYSKRNENITDVKIVEE